MLSEELSLSFTAWAGLTRHSHADVRGAMSDQPIAPDDLDRLIRDHLPAAMRFATRLTGDSATGEELVQESLYRVARSWRTYREEARFRTWFFQIIINAFRDQRRQTKSSPLDIETSDPRQPSPSDRMLEGELKTEIAACIARLPDRQREVIVLTTFEELTVAEVASVLDVSEQNVHSTLHIARKRLREELSAYLVEKS